MNCFMSFLNNLISMEDSMKNSILIFCIWGSDICWNGVRVDRMLTPDSCDDSGDEPTLLWFNFMQHSMLWLLKGCNITINCCLCWRFKLKMIFGSNIIQTLLTLRYRITCDMCQQGIIEALILNCTTNTLSQNNIDNWYMEEETAEMSTVNWFHQNYGGWRYILHL